MDMSRKCRIVGVKLLRVSQEWATLWVNVPRATLRWLAILLVIPNYCCERIAASASLGLTINHKRAQIRVHSPCSQQHYFHPLTACDRRGPVCKDRRTDLKIRTTHSCRFAI